MMTMSKWITDNIAWIAAIVEDGAGVKIDHSAPLPAAVKFAMIQASKSRRSISASNKSFTPDGTRANPWIDELNAVIAQEDDAGLHRLIRRLTGKKLGECTTPAKTAAARRNGKRGGRPRINPHQANKTSRR